MRQCLAHTNDTVLFCPCRPCELGIPHKEFREELHDDTQTKRVVLSAFEITWNIGCRVVSYKYRNWHFIFYAEATVKVNKRNPTKITLLRTGLLWRIGLFDILNICETVNRRKPENMRVTKRHVMASFAITVYDQYCRRHVVEQRVV